MSMSSIVQAPERLDSPGHVVHSASVASAVPIPRIQLPLDPSVIPQELRDVRQWVAWRFELRWKKRGDTHEPKLTKVPVCCLGQNAGQHAASVTNPSEWTTFEQAWNVAERSGGALGIGFVLTESDPFCGIDLDGCINASGEVAAEAQAVIDSIASYAEVSPSGTGIKLLVRATKPTAKCKSRALQGLRCVEVYERERFFTVTGQRLRDDLGTIANRQVELDALCDRLWPALKLSTDHTPKPPRGASLSLGDVSDDQLIDRISRSVQGVKFGRLWGGDTSDYGDDHSAADMALCNILAFWTGDDAERIDRMFRASGLMRPKWDEQRGDRTYGQRTVDHAIRTSIKSPPRPHKGSGAKVSSWEDILGDQGHAESGAPPLNAAGESNYATTTPEGNASKGTAPSKRVRVGAIDPHTGKIVLDPKRTLPTAQAFVRAFHDHPDIRTLHAWGNTFMQWRHNRYEMIEDGSIRHTLQPWLHHALRPWRDKNSGQILLIDFDGNPGSINSALESVRSLVHLPVSIAMPAWLERTPEGDVRESTDQSKPPVKELLACRSCNVHVTTGQVMPSTPEYFCANALEFDYDAQAPEPAHWLAFLQEVFEDDPEAIATLQEFMGYCLVPDTSQQKMLLLVGPRRSGKGTIGRVLRALVGEGNVANPTTSSLASNFGLQTLLGKSLAIVSDARFRGEDTPIVVERLLSIVGEDALSIDRKYKESMTVKLNTRVVIMTNEVPRLSDSSNALAGRCLTLQTRRSFYGKEDTGLTERLLAELPGILNWALAGLRRLRMRGAFMQPKSSEELVQQLEELGSPMTCFVRECCEVMSGARVPSDELYQAWVGWCQREGRDHCGTKSTFGRDLLAAVATVKSRRDTTQRVFYDGICLK